MQSGAKRYVIGPVRLLAKSGGKSGDFKVKRMIKVLFFAQVRELVGTDAPKWLRISQPLKRYANIWLRKRSLGAGAGRWQIAGCRQPDLVSFDHPLTDGDEVAFFPPVPEVKMAETKIVVGPQPFSVEKSIRGWRSVMKTVR